MNERNERQNAFVNLESIDLLPVKILENNSAANLKMMDICKRQFK